MHDERNFKLFVGLGNPSREYARTYHNVGLTCLDFLKDRWANASSWQKEKNFHFLRLPDKILVKSSVFMNESGSAVGSACRKFKISYAELLVIHDDADLAVGAYKLSFGRGSAGHHGIDSVIAALGTDEFWRLRLGVRSTHGKASDFVLAKINKTDREKIYGVLAEITEKVIEKDLP